MFYPNSANRTSFKYPQEDLFRIEGCLTAGDLMKPYFLNEVCNPEFIVAKNGAGTGLTFGRYSAMEAYTHYGFDDESYEVAVYPYKKGGDNFSAKGDSGALVFNAEGKMVGIVHGGSLTHVTFATPAHFVIDQLRQRYPHADFSRLAF